MLYLITNWILELCLSLLWRLLIQEGYQGYLDMEIPLATLGLFLCCDYSTLTFGSWIDGFLMKLGIQYNLINTTPILGHLTLSFHAMLLFNMDQ